MKHSQNFDSGNGGNILWSNDTQNEWIIWRLLTMAVCFMYYIVPPIQSVIIWSWYGFRWLWRWESLLKVMGAGTCIPSRQSPQPPPNWQRICQCWRPLLRAGKPRKHRALPQIQPRTLIPSQGRVPRVPRSQQIASSHRSIPQGEEQHNTRRAALVQRKLNGWLKKKSAKAFVSRICSSESWINILPVGSLISKRLTALAMNLTLPLVSCSRSADIWGTVRFPWYHKSKAYLWSDP